MKGVKGRKRKKLKKVRHKRTTHQWPEPESLPRKQTSPSCTCYRRILKADGVYEPIRCSLHEKTLSKLPIKRLSPLGTSMAVAHGCERQMLLRTKSGVAIPNGSNPGTVEEAPQSFIEAQLRNYSDLLENKWGERLTDTDRAEVLVRQATLYQALAHQSEALKAAENAIGLRPTFPQAYYAAGQAAFALGKFSRACDHFREGLHEAPNRKELQAAFRIALLEANKMTVHKR